jgi:hypothetical protein
MSEFREQLQSAKREYADARYAGDLAADLFGRHSGRPSYVLRISLAVAGIAAAVALFLTLYKVLSPDGLPTDGPMHPQIATTGSQMLDLTLPAMPASPTLPEGTTLVPSFDKSLTLPAMPSFPSLDGSDEQMDATNPTEAV